MHEFTKITIPADIWAKIFDSIDDAISVTDTEGNILFCNKSMERLIGMPSGSIVDTCCNILLSQISHPLNLCPREISKTSKKRETRTIDLGKFRYICIIDPILDKNNEIENFIHIISDITHLKKT